ncbi:hypothetical protein [Streptomyces sp. NPDC051636]|uniref:hypothetical protein n=1 Tax=Streptomyces sp. NPDC051636 TaxID=3365663 RepID=UPI00379A7631
MKISKVAKAIASGLAAGATAVVTAVQDGQITTSEAVTIVLAILGAYGITWAVPNKPSAGGGTYITGA